MAMPVTLKMQQRVDKEKQDMFLLFVAESASFFE